MTPAEADVASSLEAAQMTAVAMQPLPRRKLSRGVMALLVLLRVYVVIAVPIVVYAFIHALAAD